MDVEEQQNETDILNLKFIPNRRFVWERWGGAPQNHFWRIESLAGGAMRVYVQKNRLLCEYNSLGDSILNTKITGAHQNITEVIYAYYDDYINNISSHGIAYSPHEYFIALSNSSYNLRYIVAQKSWYLEAGGFKELYTGASYNPIAILEFTEGDGVISREEMDRRYQILLRRKKVERATVDGLSKAYYACCEIADNKGAISFCWQNERLQREATNNVRHFAAIIAGIDKTREELLTSRAQLIKSVQDATARMKNEPPKIVHLTLRHKISGRMRTSWWAISNAFWCLVGPGKF